MCLLYSQLLFTGWPLNEIVPEVGITSPSIDLISVVFALAFGPIIAMQEGVSIFRSTPFSAFTLPKFFTSFSVWMIMTRVSLWVFHHEDFRVSLLELLSLCVREA